MKTAPVCSHIVECPFFRRRMRCAPARARRLQAAFCRGEFARCARYRLSERFIQGWSPRDDQCEAEAEKMIEGLFPDDIERLDAILRLLDK